jgi:uncharacterized protein (DUF2384 family)
MNSSARKNSENIPSKVDNTVTLRIIKSRQSNKGYFNALKKLTNEDDEQISGWLDISVKTFRAYKNTEKLAKSTLTEHVVTLVSLVKHGLDVFGSYPNFKNWLTKENYFFGNTAPINFFDSISGIKFIDDRLTAIEYGDNA